MQSTFIFENKKKKNDNEGKGKVGSGNFIYKWYPEGSFEFNGLEEDI